MKALHSLFASVVAFALGGCAHPIVIAPNAVSVERKADAPPKIRASVGYYISDVSSNREVTTLAGGGDNVRYFPYRDIEAAYAKMLSNVFDNVRKLTSPTEKFTQEATAITYVVAPDIITTSGSTSFVTWPPTNFTVDLTSNVRDASGKLIASPRVVGNGEATFGEFFSNKGLAGQRAMTDALEQMQRALLETKFDGMPPAVVPANLVTPASAVAAPVLSKDSTSDRLEKLKSLRDKGLITADDFEKKKKEILDSM